MAAGGRADDAAAPETWGLPMWEMLFTLAFRHERRHADAMHAVLDALQHVLPCPSCRRSYAKLWRRRPPAPPTGADDASPAAAPADEWAARWLWTAKDGVNQKLGRASAPYAAVRRRFLTFHSCTSDSTVVDLLVLVAATDGVDTAHVARLARGVARAGAGVLDGALCERLAAVSEAASVREYRALAAWYHAGATNHARYPDAVTGGDAAP